MATALIGKVDNGTAIPREVSDYALKFQVVVTIERYGIYGDEWDWVARPVHPEWYPTIEPSRSPIQCDARGVIRIVATKMGSGKYGPRGFEVVK